MSFSGQLEMPFAVVYLVWGDIACIDMRVLQQKEIWFNAWCCMCVCVCEKENRGLVPAMNSDF